MTTFKNKRRMLVAVLLAVLIAVGASFAVAAAPSDAYTLSDVEYRATYAYGDTIDVQPAQFSGSGGDTVPAVASVRFPSGKAFAANRITLDEMGVYAIEYKAYTDSGRYLSAIKMFTVETTAFTFDGKGSATYGGNAYFAQEATPELQNKQGLNVTLASGATFTYNKVIDVSDYRVASSGGKDDVNSANRIIQLYVTPSTLGQKEAARIKVRLTDVYDSNNYMEVEFKSMESENPDYTRVNAAAVGQQMTGFQYDSNSIKGAGMADGPADAANYYYYDGYRVRLFQNNATYGYNGRASFDGVAKRSTSSIQGFTDNELSFYFDNADKRVYAMRNPFLPNRRLVIDLDEPLFFGADTWGGFPDGKVLLSITASDYQSGDFNFFITEIDGVTPTDASITNTVDPRIQVALGDRDPENLTAIIGQPFTLFPASAVNEFGNAVACTARVYYNYDNADGRNLQTVKNGAFTPIKVGKYAVEYYAENAFGRYSKQVYYINAVERKPFSESTFTGNKPTNAVIGQSVTVRGLEPPKYYDGKIEVTAVHKTRDGVSYTVDAQTMSFVPLYKGDYDIVYTHTDATGSDAVTDVVTVGDSDQPVFLTDAVLPRYFVKGYAYALPSLIGYKFSDGIPNEVQGDIYVKEGAAAERKLSGNMLTLADTVKDGAAVTVTYRITAGKKSDERTYTAIAVEPMREVQQGNNVFKVLDLGKFVYGGTAFERSTVNNCYVFTANRAKAGGDAATLEIVHPLLADEFVLSFQTIAGAGHYDSIAVDIVNPYDTTDFARILFEKNIASTSADTVTKITVMRGDYTVVGYTSASLDGVAGKNAVMIRKGGGDDRIEITGAAGFYPSFSKTFGGLGKANVNITLGGIEAQGNAAVAITQIMNQTVAANVTADRSAPYAVYESYSDKYNKGDAIIVPAVYGYDFIDPSPTVSYVVRQGGKIVTSTDGVLLDGTQDCSRSYSLDSSMYTTYIITLNISDQNGQRNTDVLPALAIKDETPPNIRVTPTVTAYKVGDEVTAATPETSDDYSSVSVIVSVLDPKGQFSMCQNGKFKAAYAGSYRIIYRAMDEAGNVSYAEYTVTVAA